MTTGSAEEDFVDWLARVQRASTARNDIGYFGDLAGRATGPRFRCHNGHVCWAWQAGTGRCQDCGAPLHPTFPNDLPGPPIARDARGNVVCVEHEDCINSHELALACAASNPEELRWVAGPDGGWLLVDSKGNWRAP